MSGRMDIIDQRIDETVKVKQNFSNQLKEGILKVTEAIVKADKDKKRVFVFGNGGSAADAQHLAAELVVRFLKDRDPLDVTALTTNTSIFTAIVNDYSSEKRIFSRQIRAHVKEGDVVIGISTSGNSPDVLEGIKAAKERKALCIGFTGQSGGEMAELCDILLNVPSNDTARIQESHILIIHLICEFVEEDIFGK